MCKVKIDPDKVIKTEPKMIKEGLADLVSSVIIIVLALFVMLIFG